MMAFAQNFVQNYMKPIIYSSSSYYFTYSNIVGLVYSCTKILLLSNLSLRMYEVIKK